MTYDLDKLFAVLNLRFDVTITLHDNTGILVSRREDRPTYAVHAHPFCRYGRFGSQSYDRNCLRDCQRDIDNKPGVKMYLHHCWKGATELIFPVAIDNQRVITLFVGVFRTPNRRSPPELQEEWEKLPLLTAERRNELRTIIPIFVDALASQIAARLRSEAPADRAGQIMQYLRVHFDKTVTLGDMAKLLSVSESRAGHAIKDLFGKTLKELLTAIRMRRVYELLQTTEYTMERIALMTGFGSSVYLHRMFLREAGCTPACYRETYRRQYV